MELVVTNRHPRIAKSVYECNAKVYWDFIDKENDLIWKSNNEPVEIDIPINPETQPNGLQGTIGLSYTEKLKSIGTDHSTLPQGFSKEIYLILTIQGHDVAYLILNNNNEYPIWDTQRNLLVGRNNGRLLFIPFNETHRVRIRFSCISYSENRYHTYAVNVKSWGNIEFIKSG
jgi:hypothetical protein